MDREEHKLQLTGMAQNTVKKKEKYTEEVSEHDQTKDTELPKVEISQQNGLITVTFSPQFLTGTANTIAPETPASGSTSSESTKTDEDTEDKPKKKKSKKVAVEEEEVVKSGIIKGFWQFISRNSVMALAVGLVIGSSTQETVKIINENMITPLISVVVGLFSDKTSLISSLHFIVRGQKFNYGLVIENMLNFFITLFIIYFVVKILLKRNDLIEDQEKVKVKSTMTIRDLNS